MHTDHTETVLSSPRRRFVGLPAWLTIAVLAMILGAAQARAVAPVNRSFWGKVAVNGYDVVAYFTDSKPVKGDKAFSFEWHGAVWHFATKEHRDLFAAKPESYAPQYGGYCAWAVAQNSTAGIDPNAWKIVDGKLYLNYSLDIQKQWEADIPGNIAKANQNWPGLHD